METRSHPASKERRGDQGPAPSGPFAFLSRRRWLKLALGAGGVALAGWGGVLVWLRHGAPDVPGAKVLAPYEYRTLGAIVDVLFPPGALGHVDVRTLHLPREFDDFLADQPPEDASDARHALTYLELGPLVYDHHFVPFSRLSRKQRTKHFESWMTSDDLTRRKVALAFRNFFNFVLYDHEAVWPLIHYPGPALHPLAP